MKKVFLIVAFIVVALAATSCKSQKGGCGLTGALEIENIQSTQYQA